jgi:hypothetical protein
MMMYRDYCLLPSLLIRFCLLLFFLFSFMAMDIMKTTCAYGVGSLFELMDNKDSTSTLTLGSFGATAAVCVLGIPATLFLFWASILKATAETEEDDKAFLNKTKR